MVADYETRATSSPCHPFSRSALQRGNVVEPSGTGVSACHLKCNNIYDILSLECNFNYYNLKD